MCSTENTHAAAKWSAAARAQTGIDASIGGGTFHTIQPAMGESKTTIATDEISYSHAARGSICGPPVWLSMMADVALMMAITEATAAMNSTAAHSTRQPASVRPCPPLVPAFPPLVPEPSPLVTAL